jgi:hypothetical protein
MRVNRKAFMPHSSLYCVELRRALPYLVILVWVSMEVVNWFRGQTVYYGDQGFIIYPHVNFWRYLAGVTYAVTDYPFLGVPSFPSGNLFVSLLIFTFSLIPLRFSEGILAAILLSIGSCYVYRLVGESLEVEDKVRVAVSIVSALFFSSNWGLVEGGLITEYLTAFFVYPFLPPLTYYARKFALSGKGRHFALFSIFSLLSTSSSGIVYIIQTFGLALLFSIYYPLRTKGRRGLLHSGLMVSSSALGLLYWAVPAYYGIVSPTLTREFVQISYVTFQYYNNFPFVRAVTGLGMPYDFPVYTTLIYLAIPVILLLAIFTRIRGEALLWISLFIVASVLWGGKQSPFWGIYQWLFLHIPYLVDFRTYFIAFSFYYFFVSSVSLGMALHHILSKVGKLYIPLLVVSMIALDVVAPLPVISGSQVERVTVPDYFLETASYLNSIPGHFNVLLLPESLYWFSTTWYTGVNLLPMFSTHPVFTGGYYGSSSPQVMSIYENLSSLLYNGGNETEVRNILYLLNVKFVVVEADYVRKYDVPSNVTYYLVHINADHLFKLVKRFGPMYIYQVGINSSYFLESNTTNVKLGSSELISIFKPLHSYQFVNPVEVRVNNVSSKYLIFLYSYSPLWVSTSGKPSLFLYANLYNVNSTSLTLNLRSQGSLKLSYYLLAPFSAFVISVYLWLEKLHSRLNWERFKVS